ncbi:MAG: DMT family transporter [Bacteroidetes bacterium]|nr:DMT family transporter [Bacteroidota bacterium]
MSNMFLSVSYLGELIAFATTLSWTIGIFPFTEAARRMGPNPVNHFRLVMAVILLTVISILFLPISTIQLFTSPLPQHWLWFGLSGIIGLAMGDYLAFTSFAILGPRIGSIFITLSPTAALFAGYFLIGERINFIGVIGILITIAGVIWLTLSRSAQALMLDHEYGNVKKGIIYGALSAICNGTGVVLANKGFTYQQNHMDLPFFQATWIRMVAATLIVFLITIVRGKLKTITKPIIQNKNNGFIYTLGGTIFGPVVGVSLSMLAISLLHNKPSVAQTIFSLIPVFVLPLSYLFYKEKITLKAILGALIAITGVVILIWRTELLQFLF